MTRDNGLLRSIEDKINDIGIAFPTTIAEIVVEQIEEWESEHESDLLEILAAYKRSAIDRRQARDKIHLLYL